MAWPNFDLDLSPISIGIMVTRQQALIYANDADPSMKNKVEF
jgi:hypothetical protein